jgi:hypothetical protein
MIKTEAVHKTASVFGITRLGSGRGSIAAEC